MSEHTLFGDPARRGIISPRYVHLAVTGDDSVPGMQDMGKHLLVMGGLIFAVGLVLTLGAKVPWPSRLPGDIRLQRGNLSCVFPLVACLAISVILTLVANLLLRLLNR